MDDSVAFAEQRPHTDEQPRALEALSLVETLPSKMKRSLFFCSLSSLELAKSLEVAR